MSSVPPHRTPRPGVRHTLAAGGVALALVVTAFALPTSGEHQALTLMQANEQVKADKGLPHVDPPGTPFHTHDPKFKDDLSQGGVAPTADTLDPTTATEARQNAAYVASQRKLPDPKLRKVDVRPDRTRVPTTRYAMAGGCYQLSLGSLRPKVGGSTARFTFQAIDLGRYLLYSRDRTFVSTSRSLLGATTNAITLAEAPSRATEWTVRMTKGKRFTFSQQGKGLSVKKGKLVRAGTPKQFRLQRATGCKAYPESQIGVTGRPHAGVSAFQEVRGFVDAHTHGMAYEFLGGNVHCGKPWDKYGVEYALQDCPDHTATGGVSLLGAALEGQPRHDPVGWPTFKDWPAPDSLEHEGTYYRWMERAWRGGERLFVNLLVENNQLCQVYPGGQNPCDDMESIRIQAHDMYKFQDYIDAQFGGPGKGFYRIVKTPFEARKVINAGKLAVIMGIEVSRPFGCTFKQVPGVGDVPACSAKSIDRQLDMVHKWGVRQMELTNKFDNALTGVAGDEGTTGIVVNGANFLETGTFWDFKHCEPADGVSSDRTQLAFPEVSAQQQDALFGAIGQVFGPVLPAIPLYGRPLQCNARGLTSLGEHTIRALAAKKMIFDPDHMSVKARQSSLDVIDKLDYSGVISSHSWSTPDAYTRIYSEGGFITPYAGDSTGFVDKWRQHVGWADKRYYYGIGFGADINGLGAQGNPRGANVKNKVTYPFKGINGVTINRQHAGQRVYDINKDGVAQYGLYPDWIEDLTKVAGAKDGKAIFDDMTRGPEAYLQMWERALGIQADSCRNPGLRKNVKVVERLVRRGMSTQAVMRAVGQPFSRLGRSYGVCAKTSSGKNVGVEIRFSKGGRVTDVRRKA